jgi:hypothetical protein
MSSTNMGIVSPKAFRFKASLSLKTGFDDCRPLDPSGDIRWPPLDPSAGACLVEQKVESSIPPQDFHPTYLTGRAIKGTWDDLGEAKKGKRNDLQSNCV